MTEFKLGQVVMVSEYNDNDCYDSFRKKKLKITHVDTENGEIGSDDKKMRLYSFETLDGQEVPCSLYAYELEGGEVD